MNLFDLFHHLQEGREVGTTIFGPCSVLVMCNTQDLWTQACGHSGSSHVDTQWLQSCGHTVAPVMWTHSGSSHVDTQWLQTCGHRHVDTVAPDMWTQWLQTWHVDTVALQTWHVDTVAPDMACGHSGSPVISYLGLEYI